MLFEICRTSDWDERPCKEARKQKVIEVQRLKNPGWPPGWAIPSDAETNWFANGTNHHVDGEYLVRWVDSSEIWVVEVANLMAFVEEHGRTIIDKTWVKYLQGPEFCLEIYDDYRE